MKNKYLFSILRKFDLQYFCTFEMSEKFTQINFNSFNICLFTFRYLDKHQPVLDELKDVQPPRDPKKVWELLCAHPVHVFQLVRRLKFFEEKINPLLTSESECMYLAFFRYDVEKNRVKNLFVFSYIREKKILCWT